MASVPPRTAGASSALAPRARLAVMLLLAAVVAALFAPAADFPFVEWDDPLYVSRNPQVLAGLTAPGLAWALTTRHTGNWHPLAWLSHMLDVELFGPGPRGPHLVNIGLHAGATLLVLLLFWRLEPRRPWRGVVAATIFGLHPLRVESVAWVAERKDVLCTLFSLLAVLAYLGWRRRPGPLRYLAVTAAVGAALAAKPMAVALPLLFLVLDRWPLARFAGERAPREAWRALVEKLPWLALAAGTAAVTMTAQGESGAVAAGEGLALPIRLANAALAVTRYVELTLRPEGLSALYPHPWLPGGTLPSAAVLAVALAAVAVSTLLAVRSRRGDAVATGWLWFLVAVSPTLGLVQAGPQAMADRYTYLPHVGLLLALVWGVADLVDRVRAVAPRVGGALATVLAVACVTLAAARTVAQLPAWSSSGALFRRSLEATPRNPVLLFHLGRVRLLAGDTDEAEALLRASLALRPRFAEPHRLLGLLAESRGQLVDAARELDLAVGMVPDYVEARLDLVRVLIDLDARQRAEAELTRVLAATPDSPQALFELGRLRSRQGRAAEAEVAWREAERLAPEWDEPRRELERARVHPESTRR